jgi:site-specific DNA recombinase
MNDLTKYLAAIDPPEDNPSAGEAGDKRAVSYLRVSSRGQLDTDYDPEGLSLPAQRDAAERKARSLDAVVVREFVEKAESATTARRPALKALLEFIKTDGQIDYVIVHKVDRLARNRADDVMIAMQIRAAGAQLVSVSENIDETPSGLLLHGIMASIAEFYSRNLATEILKGTTQKAKNGGTLARARLGYLNIRETIDGREIRTVALDPERAALVRAAWELYATGNYSLSDIEQIMADRGLKSRPTRKHDGQPLNAARWQNLFRSDYYIGVVRYRGKVYEGRHPQLVPLPTFERVQAVLDSQRISGERQRKHPHYLKGTLYCDECGHRLMFSRNRGKGGTYDYFLCKGKQLGTCSQPYHRVDRLEAGVERCYQRLQLSASRILQIRQAIERHIGNLTRFAETEIDRANRQLARLLDEERKLLHQHYQERITEALFEDELARIRKERAGAEKTIDRLQTDYEQLLANLETALKLAGDMGRAYALAGPTVRRLLNQAFFRQLRISEEDVAEAVLTEPYAQLLAIDLIDELEVAERYWEQTFGPNADQRVPAEVLETHRTPDLVLVRGSISDAMVELVGLEPTTSRLPAGRSPN